MSALGEVVFLRVLKAKLCLKLIKKVWRPGAGQVCALVHRSDSDGRPGLSIRFSLVNVSLLRRSGPAIFPNAIHARSSMNISDFLLFHYCSSVAEGVYRRGFFLLTLPRRASRSSLVPRKCRLLLHCQTSNPPLPSLLPVLVTMFTFYVVPALVYFSDVLLSGDRLSCHPGQGTWQMWCSSW